MPDWIQRNEDINYLQEGKDFARAWKTIHKCGNQPRLNTTRMPAMPT